MVSPEALYADRLARRTMGDDDIDVAAIAARFLAQAPPLQFPPVLDGALSLALPRFSLALSSPSEARGGAPAACISQRAQAPPSESGSLLTLASPTPPPRSRREGRGG